MAYLDFKNVRIAGISAGVPDRIVDNLAEKNQSNTYDASAFVELTGVKERRYSDVLTTADLCYEAAEKLLADLKWEKKDVDALIFVSQTRDYIEPATACILQDRLGLNKECYASDTSLGCSGWVYGLSQMAGLLQGGVKKALLLAGDVSSCYSKNDPLFGCAGTATALEFHDGAENIKFHFGTDGSGFDAVINPDGGARNKFSEKSFDKILVDGKTYRRFETTLKGMDVFAFGISTAPKSIKMLDEHFGLNHNEYDYVVLHQANMKMNQVIARKLQLDAGKVPSSMLKFGNTSSASIPLTIVTQLRDKLKGRAVKIIGCGFGIGLSWGSVAFSLDDVVVSELVEVSDDKVDKVHVV